MDIAPHLRPNNFVIFYDVPVGISVFLIQSFMRLVKLEQPTIYNYGVAGVVWIVHLIVRAKLESLI